MDYSVNEDIIEYVFEKIKHFILPSEDNNYKSKFLQSNLLLYFVVLILILKIGATLISINFPQNIFFADVTKSALENFVNQTRQSNGLKPLAENQKLNQAAQAKAQNMVQNNYFAHTSPTGITPWFWFLNAGYNYKYAGENLAIGFFDSQEVYQAWLNSPEHKANIVNPNYTEVGTAVMSGFGLNNTIVVVQEFGSQQPVKQVAVKNTNSKPVAVATKPQATVKPVVPVSNASTEAPATNTKTQTTTNPSEQVLSQTTESQNSIEPFSGAGINNLPSRFLNYALYSPDGLLQNIIYGISSVIIGILLTLILFNFQINFKRQLVFRAVLIVVLLSAATLVNREIIVSLIPHQTLI
jgi:uncharacterized protein YkwD